MPDLGELPELLSRRDYARAKARLSGASPAELRGVWETLAPLERLAAFKLLRAPEALAFFAGLGFDDKYRLLCGFERGSIAPLLEGLPPGRAALFERLGPEAFRELLRLL